MNTAKQPTVYIEKEWDNLHSPFRTVRNKAHNDKLNELRRELEKKASVDKDPKAKLILDCLKENPRDKDIKVAGLRVNVEKGRPTMVDVLKRLDGMIIQTEKALKTARRP